MEAQEAVPGDNNNDGDQGGGTENNIQSAETNVETNDKSEEVKNININTAENNKAGEEGSNDDPVVLDDILSQIVQDTIIDGQTAATTTVSDNMQINNNKRKPPLMTPKQPPVKVRRQAEPRIRSAPSVFLQRSSRGPPAPKQVVKKNLAEQFNNCVHGDPGDYICSDCFFNRWQAERDFLQPIQTT